MHRGNLDDKELVHGKKIPSFTRGSNLVPKFKRTGVRPLSQEAWRLQYSSIQYFLHSSIILSGWKLIQDLKNGYCQELIAFILFLKRQTKAAFDFSLSAGGDKRCVVGRGIADPYSKVILAFFLFLIFTLSKFWVFQKSSTLFFG